MPQDMEGVNITGADLELSIKGGHFFYRWLATPLTTPIFTVLL